jgi:hypothetical protein
MSQVIGVTIWKGSQATTCLAEAWMTCSLQEVSDTRLDMYVMRYKSVICRISGDDLLTLCLVTSHAYTSARRQHPLFRYKLLIHSSFLFPSNTLNMYT